MARTTIRPSPLAAQILSIFTLITVRTGVAAAKEIPVDERDAMVFMMVAPSENLHASSRSETYREVARIIEERSDFVLVPVETDIECAATLSCAVRSIHTERHPRMLLIMSMAHGSSGQTRILSVLIDVDIATSILSANASGATEQLENELFAKAVRASDSRVINAAEARDHSWIESFLAQSVFAHLDRTPTLGAIDLSWPRKNDPIVLDGRSIGTTEIGNTQLTRMRPGKRHLEIGSGEFRRTFELVVLAGATTPATLTDPPIRGRDYSFWSGIGVASVGVGITALGIIRAAAPSSVFLCPSTGEADCTSPSYARLGDRNGHFASGVPIVPLGYSLALMGGTWAIGAILGDRDESPWIEIAAGIGLGAAAFGVSLALDHANSFESPH